MRFKLNYMTYMESPMKGEQMEKQCKNGDLGPANLYSLDFWKRTSKGDWERAINEVGRRPSESGILKTWGKNQFRGDVYQGTLKNRQGTLLGKQTKNPKTKKMQMLCPSFVNSDTLSESLNKTEVQRVDLKKGRGQVNLMIQKLSSSYIFWGKEEKKRQKLQCEFVFIPFLDCKVVSLPLKKTKTKTSPVHLHPPQCLMASI